MATEMIFNRVDGKQVPVDFGRDAVTQYETDWKVRIKNRPQLCVTLIVLAVLVIIILCGISFGWHIKGMFG